jgi:hypothetical protein
MNCVCVLVCVDLLPLGFCNFWVVMSMQMRDGCLQHFREKRYSSVV